MRMKLSKQIFINIIRFCFLMCVPSYNRELQAHYILKNECDHNWINGNNKFLDTLRLFFHFQKERKEQFFFIRSLFLLVPLPRRRQVCCVSNFLSFKPGNLCFEKLGPLGNYHGLVLKGCSIGKQMFKERKSGLMSKGGHRMVDYTGHIPSRGGGSSP